MSHLYQLIVIGSGSGGKDAAILAARAGRRVLVVEKESLGGTCFHRGCHAIRALRACAWHYGQAEGSSRFGLLLDHSATGWTDWIGTQRRVSARLTEDLSEPSKHWTFTFVSGRLSFLNRTEMRFAILTGLKIAYRQKASLSGLSHDPLSRAPKIRKFLTAIRCSRSCKFQNGF